MDHEMKITALAPWFGSNRTLAHTVGGELSGCKWVGVVFAGSMTELRHIEAPTVVVNDMHEDIINLARHVACPEYGPKLYRRLRRAIFHPSVLNESRKDHKEIRDTYDWDLTADDDFDRAYHYFIAVWMGRSAKAGTDDEFKGNLSVRWKAGGGDSAGRFHNAVASLPAWRRLMRRCNFVSMDAFEFIDKASSIKLNANDLPRALYLDPPFPDAGEAYMHKFDEKQQRRLAETLATIAPAKLRIVCRFHDHPLIRELYPEPQWTWRRMVGRDMANQDTPEVLLINGPSLAKAGAA